MQIRMKLYNNLVNKYPGISHRYHKVHDGSSGMLRAVSWLYLLWLNFACCILQLNSLKKIPAMEVYETKKLNIDKSESEMYLLENPSLTVEPFVNRLKQYDVISFDIFDTLIFRPVENPADVFYFVGEASGIMDFRNIRIWAEKECRLEQNENDGDMEINLSDIWEKLEKEVGKAAQQGAELEMETEQKLCYANPFMLEVWKSLKSLNKRMILISDMYLPKACILKILSNAGYEGVSEIYISNEYHKSKANGLLFEEVKRLLSDSGIQSGSLIHVGDNPHSDAKMAAKMGFDVLPYPNTNKYSKMYRPFDMSYLIGSAYRAVVDNYLYCGLHSYSMEYEYGFLYGGLFVLGYCNFIHEYCVRHSINKVLFLSRDGDILKQAYNLLYPEEETEYVYWSRKAATILMAEEDRHDYFRRFLYHKTNNGYTVSEILHSMELDILPKEPDKGEELRPADKVTDKNCELLKEYIEKHWDKVAETYDAQQLAAKKYYAEKLKGVSRAAAVDIGWAGSGAVTLGHLVEKVWKLPCSITGIIAGTNTIYNAEPDFSEPFLQSGKLVAYLYSQSHNRDLLKKHDPNKDYNVFWELLLSSPTRQFYGFYNGKVTNSEEKQAGKIELRRDTRLIKGAKPPKDTRLPNDTKLPENTNPTAYEYLENLDITLKFGKRDANQAGICEIQRGIRDFVREYQARFKAFPYMLCISGRDAYAPMLVAASYSERYLKMIEEKFALEISVM